MTEIADLGIKDEASIQTGTVEIDEGVTALFAYSSSKVLSITTDEPLEDWVTLAFTDEGDPLELNNQLFFVPKSHFDAAVKEYLNAS